MDVIPTDPSAFWTMVGAIAVPLAGLIAFVYRRLRAAIRAEFVPLKEQNEWLKQQIDHQLQMPAFAMGAVELTEKSAQLRIDELRREHEAALVAKDTSRSAELVTALNKLEELQRRLRETTAERNRLAHRVEGALLAQSPIDSKNGFGLPTGPILLLRHAGKVGAIKIVDQAADARGKFVRYAWWYLPDSSTDFSSPAAQFGFDETGEHMTTDPQLRIGPLQVTWSMGGDGFGWVYYGPTAGSPDYELAITQESDISRVDASNYTFFKHPRYRDE